MKFADNFEEILSVFAAYEVEFIVVGGYAVNFYGYDRTTSDLDIWINPIEENKAKLTKALTELGYLAAGESQVNDLDFSVPSCFSLGDGKYKVDVFSHMVAVRYADASKEKVPFQTEGNRTIYFISLKDLVANKNKTGRLKDLADVDVLLKIHRFDKKQ